MASVTTVKNQVVSVSNPTANEPGKRYAKHYKVLGRIQVANGLLSIGLAIAALVIANNHNGSFVVYPDGGAAFIGSGIWCGLFFLLAGTLGVVSSKQPLASKIVGTMVFSIIAAILAFIMMCIEASGAGAASHSANQHNYSSSALKRQIASSLYPIHVILALLGSLEIIVALTNSAFCCAAVCCGSCCAESSDPQGKVVTTTTTTTTTAAPLLGPQQQTLNSSVPAQNNISTRVPPQGPVQGYPPQIVHGPQPGYPPQAGYAAQPGYVPHPGYSPQAGYAPPPGYAPQPGYPPQAGYAPQPGYAPPPPGYAPQQMASLHSGSAPPPEYPQPAFAPDQPSAPALEK